MRPRNLVEIGDTINKINPTSPIVGGNVADSSRLRLRAEIDERDICNMKLGQHVNIISEFDRSLQPTGKDSQVEAEMCRRSIKNSYPADENDGDVLEMVIDVEVGAGRAARMPVGDWGVVVFER